MDQAKESDKVHNCTIEQNKIWTGSKTISKSTVIYTMQDIPVVTSLEDRLASESKDRCMEML